MTSGREWIEALPAELAGQRRILAGLLDFSEEDPDARWFALSCSLARGAGDRLSDVDAGIGVPEDTVAAVAERILGLDLGERVETLLQPWPGTVPMRRIFIQFTDDTQLDLVVMASLGRGRAPDEVVLFDPDGLLAEEFTPEADKVDGAKVREWTFLGLVALADLAKYLDRGSYWEAHARLQEVRDRIWAPGPPNAAPATRPSASPRYSTTTPPTSPPASRPQSPASTPPPYAPPPATPPTSSDP